MALQEAGASSRPHQAESKSYDQRQGVSGQDEAHDLARRRSDARNVTATLRRIDPVVPIVKSDTIREHVETTLAPNRLGLLLFIAFGALAMLLTGLGLHAVVSYAVAYRTREIGLRVALGAVPGEILRLVAKHGLAPVAGGLVAGIGGFLASSAALRQFMFGLPANQPLALVAVAACVATIAALAMLIPARRALAVDPAVALRRD
jgi:putative ABC transport system permease protein